MRKKKLNFKKTAHLALIAGLFGGGIVALWISTIKIPDFKSFEERKITESTKIYDRTGEVLLFDIHQDIKRTIVPFSEISRYVKNATVAIEDAEFYEHRGIKPTAILRALITNLLSGNLTAQGGSTITQQVVKNSVLTKEKNISRKIKEAVLSIKLEQAMSKEEILSIYLNEIPYGGNIYGAEEASNRFFGKNANNLTLAEAAYLAALPKAPTFYSPYGNNKNRLDERKDLVLKRMTELGFISPDEGKAASEEEVIFTPQENSLIRAPHFIAYVRALLEKKYGQDELETGGLKIITTLDWKLQQEAEAAIRLYAKENEEKFSATNSGIVAIDPSTGQILAMVGSRDYFEVENNGNFNVTLAHRQPGSAFKPFVYATAFNKGLTPETTVFDVETQFQTTCTPEGKPINEEEENPAECYTPVNYDGLYRGPISLRNALAQSINVPAIKTLYLTGIGPSIETARNMGISGLENQNRYGLTLVLGGGEVTLLDITSAYGVFANDGIRNPHTPILKIEDKQGRTLEQFKSNEQIVLPENTARLISSILSDNEARAPIFGTNSLVYFPGRDVAAKTGTTNDYRDAWIIGYTPNLAVGAWAGNNDNTPMEKKIAGLIVTPMWHEFFRAALREVPDKKFNKPLPAPENLPAPLKGFWQGGTEYQIDTISGKLVTEYTPEETKLSLVVPEIHSILYWIDKKTLTERRSSDPKTDPQFELWEHGVGKWAEENKNILPTTIMPTEFDDVHLPELQPKISLISPLPQQIFSPTENVIIHFSAQSKYPISEARFFLNNVFLGASKTPPFNFNFRPSSVSGLQNKNTIKIVVYDSVRNKTEVTGILNLSAVDGRLP